MSILPLRNCDATVNHYFGKYRIIIWFIATLRLSEILDSTFFLISVLHTFRFGLHILVELHGVHASIIL